MFLATIIFDEAGTIIDLCLANITGEEFAIETAENLIRAGGVTATCWGAIALGASPAGFVVMAAAIGGHILIGTAIDLIHTYNTRNLVSLNDFIGRLPTAISQRMSVFEGYHRSLIDDGGEGPFLPHSRTSIFEPKQRSVFDFDNN